MYFSHHWEFVTGVKWRGHPEASGQTGAEDSSSHAFCLVALGCLLQYCHKSLFGSNARSRWNDLKTEYALKQLLEAQGLAPGLVSQPDIFNQLIKKYISSANYMTNTIIDTKNNVFFCNACVNQGNDQTLYHLLHPGHWPLRVAALDSAMWEVTLLSLDNVVHDDGVGGTWEEGPKAAAAAAGEGWGLGIKMFGDWNRKYFLTDWRSGHEAARISAWVVRHRKMRVWGLSSKCPDLWLISLAL